MDDGFLLDEFNEEQFESLLDNAADQLPDLDTGVLGQGGHDTSDLDVLNEDIFESADVTPRHVPMYSSLPSPGGPMLNQPMGLPSSHRSSSSQPGCSPHPSMHASPAPVPQSPHQMQSPASVPPSPATHQFATPSPAQPPSPVTYLPMKSPAAFPPPPSPVSNMTPQPSPANLLPPQSPASSIPPSSPLNKHYSVKSPGSVSAPKSPRGGSVPHSVLSPQSVSLPQNSVILAPSGPGGGATVLPPGASFVPGNVISGMQPLQFSSSGTLVNSGGQVFQIQLQPNTGVGQAIVTNTTASKYHPPQSTSPVKGNKQPHLLPKPISNINSQTVGVSGISPQDRTRLTSTLNSMVTTQNQAPVTNVSAGQTQHSIIINSNGVLSSVQPGGTPIIMGQMVAQSGGGTAGTPMIIQQQGGGGPMLLLRPNAPLQTTPTLVPIAAQPGQFIVQQGGQQRGVLAPNQQVKIIPQNQVQMQQIQTPNGPKLIALPMGQTLLPGQNLIATSSSGIQLNPGSIQLQANPPNINLSNSSVIAGTATTGGGFTLQQGPAAIQSSTYQNQGLATLQATPSGLTFSSSQSNVMSNIGSTAHMVTTTMYQPQMAGGGVLTSAGSSSTSTNITADSVIQQNKFFDKSSLSPKKKKSKKKKKDIEEVPSPQVITSQPPPTTTAAQKTFDLGALMKDAGLDIDDFDSFSMDQGSGGGSQMDLGFSTSHTISQSDDSNLPIFSQSNSYDMIQQDNSMNSQQIVSSSNSQMQFSQQQPMQMSTQNSGQIISIGHDSSFLTSGQQQSHQQQQSGQLLGNQSIQIIGDNGSQMLTTNTTGLAYSMQAGAFIQGGSQISSIPVSLPELGGQVVSQASSVQSNLLHHDSQMTNVNAMMTSGGQHVVVTSSTGPPTHQMISQQQGITLTANNGPQGITLTPSGGQLIQGSGGIATATLSTSAFPPGSSFQLMRGPDGQYILQTAPGPDTQPAVVTTSSNIIPEPVIQQQQQPSTPLVTATPPRSSPRATQRSRQPTDPNRTPLMEDDTLPHGWHRKVSQRKSGASAGRYEVFIIGPSGKRFRSRNELKAFFEKTGETSLNPDDFDFSTFGRNNTKGGVVGPTTPVSKPPPGGGNTGLVTPQRRFQQPVPVVVSIPTTTPTSQPQVITTVPGLPAGFQLQIATTSNFAPVTPSGSIITTTSNTPTLQLNPVPTIIGGSGSSSTSSIVPGRSSGQPAISPESELMKKLEVSGMASVAAARALETAGTQGLNTRNNLLQNIQEPLPQSALTSPPALDLPSAPPTLELKPQPGNIPTRQEQPQTSSYQDADETISNLLKRLHQQPVPIKQEIESNEIIMTSSGINSNSLPGGRQLFRSTSATTPNLKSPEPPVINSMPHTVVKSSIFAENAHSPSMPVLVPQVPVTEQASGSSMAGSFTSISSVNTSSTIPNSSTRIHESSFQNSYLDSLAKSQIPDKKSRGRTSSGPIHSPGGRMPLLSPPVTVESGLAQQDNQQPQHAKPASVIHQNPRFEPTMLKTESGMPTSISIQTTSLSSAPSSISLGGAGSQIRAMQHAPPNTRLVRGPNGQVTAQKVQTIELTHEMQRAYKKVEQRISEIESKTMKTAQDEAELASLQAKQHQILSTGRPVTVMQQPVNIPQVLVTSAQSGVSQPNFQRSQQSSVVSMSSGPSQSPSILANNLKSGQVIMSTAPAGPSSIIRPVNPQNNTRGNGNNSGQQTNSGLPPGSLPLPPGVIDNNGPQVQIVGGMLGGQMKQPGILSVSGLKPVPQSELQNFTPSSGSHMINPALPDIRQRFVPDPRVPIPASYSKTTATTLTTTTNSQPQDQEVKYLGTQPLVTNPALMSMPGGQIAATAGPLPKSMLQAQPPQPTTIPQLTEAQQKIIAEFKAKIANIPPDQQQAVIAANKANLLKQLNFQPTQLRTLQGAGRGAPQQVVVRPGGGVVQNVEVIGQPQVGPRPGMQPDLPGPVQQIIVKPATTIIQPDIQQIGGPSTSTNAQIIITPQNNMQKVVAPPLANINKAKKIAWVESQLKKDQHEAVNPSYKTPFFSKDDACKRLLRYHVFDEPSMSIEEWEQSEEEFSIKSQQLLNKYDSMLSKYHILLLQESTRMCSSSEEVMLARQWEADERAALAKEKEDYFKRNSRLNYLESKPSMTQEDKEELDALLEEHEPEMPEIPDHWHSRYEEVVGKPYESVKSVKVIKEEITTKVLSETMEKMQPLTPIQDLEVKKELDNVEMPVLQDERLYQHPPDIKTSIRSRNSSQTSLESFKSEQGSISSIKKEIRISLTNIMSAPHLKKELIETGSIQSSTSRPHSVADLSSPEPAGFVGLKFARSTSGRWSTSLKRDLELDIESPSQQPEWKKTRTDSPHFDSDSDDDFCLSGVRGGDTVQSMLSRTDHDDNDHDNGEDEVLGVDSGYRLYSRQSITFGSDVLHHGSSRGTPISDQGDTDSVQNVVNSILDMQDCGGIQTPDDLNNLTGLLDSMEEEEAREEGVGATDQDPSLDAAVKSIQDFL